MTSGSSKGTQKKYYDNGYWYKENLTGSEGFAEELASEILKCSNLSNFVEYKQCKVNNRSGCRSQNFLQPDEMFLSFERNFDVPCFYIKSRQAFQQLRCNY